MTNGPPVHEFDSLKYAEEWLGRCHLPTDAPCGAGGIMDQRPLKETSVTPSEEDYPAEQFQKYKLSRSAPF